MDTLVGSYLRSLGYLVGLLCVAYGSSRIGRAVHPGGDAIERLARALAVAFGFVIVVGVALGVFGALTWVAFLAASVAIAAVGHRLARADAGGKGEAPEAAADAAHPHADEAPAATLATTWPLVLPLLAFLPHWARSIASPPRAWDALTYHLPRAVAWLQDGGFRFRPMPDAGRYYAFFPPGGDLIFAQTFLAGHADALLFVAYAATMAFVVTGTYALARSMGARSRSAAVAGALVGTLPCVVQASASAYVDATALGLFCACLASVVRASTSRFVARELLLAAVLGGAAAVTKSTGYALVAVALATLLLARVRGRATGAQLAAGVLLAVLPVALWVGYTYVHTGSPTYPFALRLGGRELFAGNELLRVTLDGSTGYGD